MRGLRRFCGQCIDQLFAKRVIQQKASTMKNQIMQIYFLEGLELYNILFYIMKASKSTIHTHFTGATNFLHDHIMHLNNSKYFAGVIMILLNVGSKFISIQFSKSTEEYIKYSVTKQLLVFSMAWMGTRDIYTALGLTAIFTILSEYLLNEESSACIVPHKYRILHKLIDTNNDGAISDTEISAAVAVLEKAKREKQKKQQKDFMVKMDFHKYDYDAPID